MPEASRNKSGRWTGLIAAALLFCALATMAFVTSTPVRSPAPVVITAGYRVLYRTRPLTNRAQLSQLHVNASKLPKEQCVACHGDMRTSEVSLHQLHLTSELLPGLACHDCHKSIDIEAKNNRYVVKWVDEGFCKRCHSAFPGLDPASAMKPSDFQKDCATCHTGQHAYSHNQPYLSQVLGPRDCPGCHGGRILPWTQAHEQPNWLAQHGRAALSSGARNCFKCHDYGFKFCNDCHSQRPPSHSPRSNWLLIHPEKAQRDTRVCFTCHEATFCKKCHVNHQPNWLNTHQEYVRRNGSAWCGQCHSITFCSSCHSAPSMGSIPVPST